MAPAKYHPRPLSHGIEMLNDYRLLLFDNQKTCHNF